MSNQTTTLRVALAQTAPLRGALQENRQTILARLHEAADGGARLIVFPECALSGYVFHSAEEALPASEPVPGPTTQAVLEVCRQRNIYAVVGLLERSEGQIYNSAFVAGPEGLITTYRKCHLPVIGVDRFAARGNTLPVIDLPSVRIGLLICYDLRFPEAARTLALRGAEVLVLPTNWPEGAESSPDFLTRARAWENRIFVVACNRVGIEEGIRFLGRSQVITPAGTCIQEADPHAEGIWYADIVPAEARQKRLIVRPGVFELDPVGHRRPELYDALL
ncbi:MAG: carbon-nitrogen hydrolase family protein [Chloroherpetonaceae bacterium]|nr:carbon-nitrogen hydrolase family protein [Chthonomonadaceae bacterium]MDW8206683.1 carbon-nitrogen hydrolase family protein [Chloroherpetonaceae bacterium]